MANDLEESAGHKMGTGAESETEGDPGAFEKIWRRSVKIFMK